MPGTSLLHLDSPAAPEAPLGRQPAAAHIPQSVRQQTVLILAINNKEYRLCLYLGLNIIRNGSQ